MIKRAIYLGVLGIVLAGIVHICIILMIPSYGTRGAWAFLSGRTDLYSFTLLRPEETGAAISEIDPLFSYGICRFDLDEAPLRLVGPAGSGFWSTSVFDDSGAVVYSLNHRTAINNKLDMVILNPLQSLAVRENPIEDIESSVVIEASVSTGFAIVRVFEPDDSWRETNQEFLRQINCQKMDIAQ